MASCLNGQMVCITPCQPWSHEDCLSGVK
jgi:hypothetical protein